MVPIEYLKINNQRLNMNFEYENKDKFSVSFSDIVRLLKQGRGKIISFILICGLFGAVLSLIQPLQYKAEGSFKEKGMKSNDISSSSIVGALVRGNGVVDNEAASLMISRRIVKETIQKLQLQAVLFAIDDREKLFQNIKNNILLVWESLANSRQIIIPDLCCPIKIQKLIYEGEIPLNFVVELQENGQFELVDTLNDEKLPVLGKLNEPFQYEELSFVLVPSKFKNSLKKQTFNLRIEPLEKTYLEVLKNLKIEMSKKDPSLLNITYAHRDRYLAKEVINTIMHSYQDYLRDFHRALTSQQLSYLEDRRKELATNLVDVMHKHANFLVHDLYDTGFIESENEMRFLAESKHVYKQKLRDNELEIKRLLNIIPNTFAFYDHGAANGKNSVINEIFNELRLLKEKKEILELEVKKKSIAQEDILKDPLKNQWIDQKASDEYRGINLELATDLYLDFSKQQVELEKSIRQNLFFINQIEDPNFEITSLSAGLEDSVSVEMIQKASELILNLRDQDNQSPREQERIKSELKLQRTFLTMHLKQMVQLIELNKFLIDEKILSLQNISLRLIYQRIALLENSLNDYLKTRLENLKQENQIVINQMEHIHQEMKQIPQKWISEQLLTQEVATNRLIVEEIARLVESKNIADNIEIVQSAPIDLAFVPTHPISPKFFLMAFLGMFIGGWLSSFYVIGKGLK